MGVQTVFDEQHAVPYVFSKYALWLSAVCASSNKELWAVFILTFFSQQVTKSEYWVSDDEDRDLVMRHETYFLLK